MSSQDPDKPIALKVGDKEYAVDLKKMPYFKTWSQLQISAERDAAALTHDPIRYFDVAFRCVNDGYRNCFRLLWTDLSSYYALCDTLDYLLVDVLNNHDFERTAGEFRTVKPGYHENYNYRSTKRAKDAAFRFLYKIYGNKFETTESNKVFGSALFIISHRDPFKHNMRRVIREAFCEKFTLIPKQRVVFDKWPVYENDKPVDSHKAATTTSSDEDYIDYEDSDDYGYWSNDS